ncbi:PDDEXK family nuclease [Desulfocastanea catecholica]
MYATPFIVNDKGETELLERVPFGSGFSENWLQNRLFENPQSLPLLEIDPAYQQVCPLCMEMNTGAGPIDVVYITPQGRLVIIETKLWRNPEARRKVIAQVLDYAKELKAWSYADIQREVSRRTGIKGNSPFQIVSKRFGEIEEAVFVDGVTQSLRHGDFMLIIAGDGIRQDAQGIVQFLQDVGHMRFVLAMIEVAVYKHTLEDMFVIQPRTLLKTQQLNRDIEYSLPHEITTVTSQTSSEKEEWRQKYKEYWTRFLSTLTLDDPEQPMANVTATGNLTFSLPPSGATAWITTFFYKQLKEVGCFVRLKNDPLGRELYQSLLEEKNSIEADLPFPVKWDEERRMIIRCMQVTGDWPPVNDKRVDEYLAETINGFTNTFRPRLERLSGN